MPRLFYLTARLFATAKSESARWRSTTTTTSPKYFERLLPYARSSHDLKSWRALEKLLSLSPSLWCLAALSIPINFLASFPTRDQTKSTVFIIHMQQSQCARNNNTKLLFSTIIGQLVIAFYFEKIINNNWGINHDPWPWPGRNRQELRLIMIV